MKDRPTIIIRSLTEEERPAALGFALTDSEQTVNSIRFTAMAYRGGV